MRNVLRQRWLLSGSVLLTLALVHCSAASAPGIITMAEREVTTYLDKLADLHCTEAVTQEKLSPNGHVEAVQRAQFDYLLMMSGNANELQLNESRIESPSDRHKASTMPMLVSNGISTMLLIFHPYYRDSFQFEVGPEELMHGEAVVPVRFTPIAGRRMPAALAMRGREYPLALQGTAWLDGRSGAAVKIDASLQHDMSDVGLSALHIEVEYQSNQLKPGQPAITLPALATVDVTTPKQHWRNTHRFDAYKSFSTEAEQAADVKVHVDSERPGDGSDATSSPKPKEKP